MEKIVKIKKHRTEEEIKAYKAKWAKDNRESLNKKNREWILNNKEKHKQIQENYKKSEKYIQKEKEYR